MDPLQRKKIGKSGKLILAPPWFGAVVSGLCGLETCPPGGAGVA